MKDCCEETMVWPFFKEWHSKRHDENALFPDRPKLS